MSNHPALVQNRVAVVTGAASGIGLAASTKFAQLGMKVCMADSNRPALEAAAAKLRTIAVCMRQHGVPQFPDPRTSVPINPSGIQEITDFDGVILLFPSTMNLQAPAYQQALKACGAPPLGLPH